MNARPTLKSTNARIDALEAKLDVILAAVSPAEPAKVTRRPARKTKPQPKAVAKPKRTAQPKADLGRKGWNRALSALARSKGSDASGSVYSQVVTHWAQAQECREAGMTPAQALAHMGF